MEDPAKRDIPRSKNCGATTRQGTDCGHRAGWGTDHPGFGRCKLHGGATPTGRKHAETLRQEYWARLVEMADPALTGLLHLVTSAEAEPVRLGAIRDVLDRAGLGAKHVHEHTGPAGGPIPVEVRAAELLARIKELRPAAKPARNTAPSRGKSRGKAGP